jgi:acyl-coenzyme A thioesterase PaaI-like protein
MTDVPSATPALAPAVALVEASAKIQSTSPIVSTLGIEVLELDAEHAVLRQPDRVLARNHMGGPHAGAIFTLGETAAATLLVENFEHWLDRLVPLAVKAEISWSKLARSAVTAEARMLRPVAEIEAELAAGIRPEWASHVVFRREQDLGVCAEMTIVLTLVPRRD